MISLVSQAPKEASCLGGQTISSTTREKTSRENPESEQGESVGPYTSGQSHLKKLKVKFLALATFYGESARS